MSEMILSDGTILDASLAEVALEYGMPVQLGPEEAADARSANTQRVAAPLARIVWQAGTEI